MSDEAEDAAGLSPGKDDNEVWRKSGRKDLRQHRIILVRRLRSQNCRQIGQKPQAILSVLARIFGRYDGLLCKQDACLELCGVALNGFIGE